MLQEILQYHSGTIQASLGASDRALVQNVSFSLAAGERLALIGETGSGKTMIAQSILGVLPENVRMTGGTMTFCGAQLPSGRKLRALLGVDIVYIPQNGHEFLNPARTVYRQLGDSLKRLGVPARSRRAAACEKLAMVGFPAPEAVLEKYPFQLSGGMAQRVTVALALCSNAKLLIADEPTNGLDAASKERLLTHLRQLFPNAAQLLITHDISAAALCDRVLVLCGGKPLETGPATAVLQGPRHPYTAALLHALVENGMQETPNLRAQAGACPFYGRCPEAQSRCRCDALPHCAEGEREWWCCAE